MAVAIPVGGVVLLNCFRNGLATVDLNRDIINAANGYLILMKDVSMTTEQREAVTIVSVAAFQSVWDFITGVAIIGGISSGFLWRKGGM
jgi:hypothetical protein